MLEIASEPRGQTLVVSLTGRIDASSSSILQEQVTEWIDSGLTHLVFNLNSMTYVSSAGLRVILLIAKKIKEVDGSIKLCALTPAVKEVFDICGFSGLFTVLPSVDEAL